MIEYNYIKKRNKVIIRLIKFTAEMFNIFTV